MKEKLIQLGAHKLAEVLIEIGETHADVVDLINRLIATPNENLKRFKTKLTSLKKSDHFISWKETDDFVLKLRDLLDDLQMGRPSPNQGLELIVAFFKTDDAILNRSDDSDGMIGQIYSYDARNLFIEYASSCDEKDWIEGLLYELILDDDFGVRESILEHAKEYLPKSNIQSLIKKFQERSELTDNKYKKGLYLRLVESLARQTNDPKLFEKTRTSDREPLSSRDCLDIAHVYVENEEPQTALSWAERADEKQCFGKKELLLKIHTKLKNHDEQMTIAKSLFKKNRSTQSFMQFLSIVGEDKKEVILKEELKEIFKENDFSLSTASFLVDQQLLEEGEKYIIAHESSLNGDFYGFLLSIVKSFEQAKFWLAASLIYRALLNSILDRAYSKAYPYGVRYLKKLDKYSLKISDWQSFDNHSQYKENLLSNHGRKSSFWTQYQKITENPGLQDTERIITEYREEITTLCN
jgi:hypothetical protein